MGCGGYPGSDNSNLKEQRWARNNILGGSMAALLGLSGLVYGEITAPQVQRPTQDVRYESNLERDYNQFITLTGLALMVGGCAAMSVGAAYWKGSKR